MSMLAVFGGKKVSLLKEAGLNNSVYFMTAKTSRVYFDARVTISCKRVFHGSSTRTITHSRGSNGAVAFLCLSLLQKSMHHKKMHVFFF